MLYPAKAKASALSKDYDIIPVCKEIYADIITPIALLKKISQVSKRYYLLESIEGGERWGRYSFLGYDPIERITCKNGNVEIENDEKTKRIETKNPLEVIRERLACYRSPTLEGMPPFTGGLVGYSAYSMFSYTEPKLKIKRGDENDFDYMLFDKIIAYDHLRQKIIIIVNMKTASESYENAVSQIENIESFIKAPIADNVDASRVLSPVKCNMTGDEYSKMVDRAKEYIKNGDIFQAVLSRKFELEYEGSLINAYRVLRTTNPSPYMVFMNIDDRQIISTSPETLVKLNKGRLYTFPVAGSRQRGSTREEDLELERDLMSDEKELSEHNMLVDLARNDIGRVAKFGSVRLENYKMVHRYSKIMHIASEVQGEINDGLNACDVISSILPAGTLSGAPKIRACEIIEELEKDSRGIYGGALGYIDFAGNMDTCIAIRMAVLYKGVVTIQAGGGIVYDSIPENEYNECGHKAEAVIQAILNSQEVY